MSQALPGVQEPSLSTLVMYSCLNVPAAGSAAGASFRGSRKVLKYPEFNFSITAWTWNSRPNTVIRVFGGGSPCPEKATEAAMLIVKEEGLRCLEQRD